LYSCLLGGDPGWQGETGYIDAALLKKYLPPPAPDTLVYVSGPDALVDAISGGRKVSFNFGPEFIRRMRQVNAP